MQANAQPPQGQEVSQVLDAFAAFFNKAVAAHPRKAAILGQMNAFLSFLAKNRDDLGKGYQFLRDMRLGEERKLELAFPAERTSESEFAGFRELSEFDFLQGMKVFNCDSHCFSYDLLLLCVSLRFWDLILAHIDRQQLPLLASIKDRVFHDTLAQSTQEKIIGFFERLEAQALSSGSSFRRAFARLCLSERPAEFLLAMVPVLKQLIIKFLINSEWNFVRERLQDKLNTNSLNQIFALFKNQSAFPQRDAEVQILEENTQNFLQILALGLNLNIRVLWLNSTLEGERNCLVSRLFAAKKQDEAVGTVNVLVSRTANGWSYHNLFHAEEWGLEESSTAGARDRRKSFDTATTVEAKEKPEGAKNGGSKSESVVKPPDDPGFPLSSIAKQSQDELSSFASKVLPFPLPFPNLS